MEAKVGRPGQLFKLTEYNDYWRSEVVKMHGYIYQILPSQEPAGSWARGRSIATGEEFVFVPIGVEVLP